MCYSNTLDLPYGHSCDDMFAASSALIHNIKDPKFAMSEEPDETPLNTRFEMASTIFEWLEQPGNELRRERFGKAMIAAQALIAPEMILQGTSPSF